MGDDAMALVFELARELLNHGIPVRADIYAQLIDAGYDPSEICEASDDEP